MNDAITHTSLNELPIWLSMSSITLEEMKAVKLMNRIDTKYVVSDEDVMTLLERVSALGYRVQIIGDKRAARYDTLYYDTAERDMYIRHHNRILTRQKIRTRHYVDNDATFLEVKNKSNRGRTDKRRTSIEHSSFANIHSNAQAVEFLAERSHYALDTLSPALATRFTRITIVNPTLTERVTIDLNLEYEDVRSGCRAKIRGMAIIEIKQDGNIRSKAKEILNRLRVKPMRVSKYCLGTALTVDDIKRNRMIEKIRRIKKRVGYNEIR